MGWGPHYIMMMMVQTLFWRHSGYHPPDCFRPVLSNKLLTVFIQDQKVIFQTVLSMPPSPLILWWWCLLNFLQNKSSSIRNEAGTVPGPTTKNIFIVVECMFSDCRLARCWYILWWNGIMMVIRDMVLEEHMVHSGHWVGLSLNTISF